MRQVSVSKPRAPLLKDLFVRNLGVLCGNAHPAVGVPSADVLLLTQIPVFAAYEQPGSGVALQVGRGWGRAAQNPGRSAAPLFASWCGQRSGRDGGSWRQGKTSEQ